MGRKQLIKRMAAGILAGAMALSLVVTASPASAKKNKKDKTETEEPQETREVDLNGTYHAALGVQTATDLWLFRAAYYEDTQNSKYGTDMWDKMFYASKETGEDEAAEGTFTDVEIAGNGTYTVSLEGADFLNETTISQLHVATDIPLNDTIKFSDVILKINGRTIVEMEEAVMENEEPYLQGGMDMLLMNHWRAEIINALKEKGVSEDSANGYNMLDGGGDDNISVTFTISGFEYDNEGATGDGEDVEPALEGTESQEAVGNGAASADNTKEAESDSGNSALIIIVVLAVIVIIAVVVAVSRKKKE